LKLYFDSCCFNRPYDDQSQERIHLESEAILAIIKRSKQNNIKIIGSPALDLEISRISNNDKMEKVKEFYEQTVNVKIEYNELIINRVKVLSEKSNIRTLDKFHLAFAENAEADILLTTDDKFEKACLRLNLNTNVSNPLKYLMGNIKNENDG
jgi:predicted nucleic acid-binding protein